MYSFKVIGGSRLRRFLATRGQSGAHLPTPEQGARRFVQLFPIETLRANVPKRTGRLARSLVLRRRGSAVELHGLFYGRFEPNRSVIEATVIALAERTAVAVRRSFQ